MKIPPGRREFWKKMKYVLEDIGYEIHIKRNKFVIERKKAKNKYKMIIYMLYDPCELKFIESTPDGPLGPKILFEMSNCRTGESVRDYVTNTRAGEIFPQLLINFYELHLKWIV